MNGGPRGDVTCRWHAATCAGAQGFPVGEDTGPCRRGRLGEEGWQRWPPTMNEARPFSQEPPSVGIAEQGCPPCSSSCGRGTALGPKLHPLPRRGALRSHPSPGLWQPLILRHCSATPPPCLVLPCAPSCSRSCPLVLPPSLSSQADITTKILKGASLH